MPLILLGVVVLIVCAAHVLPLAWKSWAYGLSLSIKSLILFLLPVVIFGLLFKTAASLAKSATQVIFLLLAAVCCSNLLSTMLSYSVGHVLYLSPISIAFPEGGDQLVASWAFSLPQWVGNSHAMLAGLILGVVFALLLPKQTPRIAEAIGKIVNAILKGFMCVMPLFVGGFVLKLVSDGHLGKIVQDYAWIFGVIACAQFAYIALLYLGASRFSWRSALQSIRNMLPAAMAGFGAMSSAAAMPLTLAAAEKNSSNPKLAQAIIPATVNIHLIGDCFAIPIFAFAVLKNFGVAEPTFAAYFMFALYFVIAKFSVAAIPGGGILVMLPILEMYLGFDAQMMSLITALYILFDPVITSANVLGNGAFSMLMSRRLSVATRS
ncbi:MAG: cation:dicarboxylase symporter family transporter [Chlamydiota bacterium]